MVAVVVVLLLCLCGEEVDLSTKRFGCGSDKTRRARGVSPPC